MNNHTKKTAFKLLFGTLGIVTLSILAGAGVLHINRAWAITLPMEITAPLKQDVFLEETDAKGGGASKANVLFLLDTGSPMTFTPKGTMPEWGVNVTTRAAANAMLYGCTYGHGGLGLRKNNSASFGASRYGREDNDTTDGDANNVSPGNIDLNQHLYNYYSPFDHENNLLTSTMTGTIKNRPAPYALVFKNQNYWQNGHPGTFTRNDLVPNDSRMYKMKLVMWRVLSDTVLLENLRIGMATTFQEMNSESSSYIADFYKDSPYGVSSSYPEYTNGTGPSWATGLSGSTGYGNSTACHWGIDRDYYDLAHGSATWRLINRAYLRLPIQEYSDAHIARFRLWLDGLEDITNTSNYALPDPYYFRNPELIADGKTFLSTAIYPGHPQLSRATLLNMSDQSSPPLNHAGVIFSHRTLANNTHVRTSANSSTRTSCFNYFKPQSGEALGTILDFFSPPVKNIGNAPGDAYNVSVAPEVSFPLKDPCEKNWVVIFTAGDDSTADYSAAKAVEDLYNHTKNNKLTKFVKYGPGNNGSSTFEEIQLDDGVRTLVVGFVDPTDPAVQPLRDRLNDMARRGDPGNGSASAYFANDVPGLIAALRAILVRINNDIQPARGPMLEGSSLEDQTGDAFNLFAATYRINLYDQWEGSLRRYEVTSDDSTGELITTEKWELNKNLLYNTPAGTPTGNRKLYYWQGTAFSNIAFTGSMTDASEHPLASLMGLTAAHIASMDVSNIPGNTFSGKIHPSRAMANWLYGYEVSYVDNNMSRRRYLLSDFGQSGTVIAGPPTVVNSLPGFNEWASHIDRKNLKTRVYAQTNDGILHVINPTAGQNSATLEEMAIVPPPVLIPSRLPTIKLTENPAKQKRWIDADEYLTLSSDDIPISSRPAYLLDGTLTKWHFDLKGDGTGWGTYLFSTLGRAGNGIYMMDISIPDAPKFFWYRETIDHGPNAAGNDRITLLRMRAGAATPETEPAVQHIEITPTMWTDIFANPKNYPFYQLGFNSPKPAAGVVEVPDSGSGTKLQNMIVIPGGMRRALDTNGAIVSVDLTDNGKIGAALYITDPDAAKHKDFNNNSLFTYVFNSASVETSWRNGSAVTGPNPWMGMMVSPPYLISAHDSRYKTGSIIAPDNRGNIFQLQMESVDTFGVITRLAPEDWKLKTVATLRGNGEVGTECYASPYAVAVGHRYNETQLWVAGATANVGTRDNESGVDNALMRNVFQMLYSFKLPADDGSITKRPDWTQLDAENPNSAIADTADGWFTPLQGETLTHGEEYSSTQPALLGNHLYFATFIPKKMETVVYTDCGSGRAEGKARLYAVDMGTGANARWTGGKKYIELGGLKIAGFTHSVEGNKQSLILTYDVLNQAEADASIQQALDEEGVYELGGDLNALVIELVGGGNKNPDVVSGDAQMTYWIRK